MHPWLLMLGSAIASDMHWRIWRVICHFSRSKIILFLQFKRVFKNIKSNILNHYVMVFSDSKTKRTFLTSCGSARSSLVFYLPISIRASLLSFSFKWYWSLYDFDRNLSSYSYWHLMLGRSFSSFYFQSSTFRSLSAPLSWSFWLD